MPRTVLIEYPCVHCDETVAWVRVKERGTAVLLCPKCGWEWTAQVSGDEALEAEPDTERPDAEE